MDLWARCRDAQFGGVRHLPCGGGYGEQPAALLDAFALLEEALKDMS